MNLRRQANEHSAGSWLSFHELSALQSELLVQSTKQKIVISDMLKTADQRRTAVGMGWAFTALPVEGSEKPARYGVYVKDARIRKAINGLLTQPLSGIPELRIKLEEFTSCPYLLCSLGIV